MSTYGCKHTKTIKAILTASVLLLVSACSSATTQSTLRPATIDTRSGLPVPQPVTVTPKASLTPYPTATPTTVSPATPIPREALIAYEKTIEDEAGVLYLIRPDGAKVAHQKIGLSGRLGFKMLSPDGKRLLFSQVTNDQTFFARYLVADLGETNKESPAVVDLKLRGSDLGTEFFVYPAGWLESNTEFVAVIPRQRLVKFAVEKTGDISVVGIGPDSYQPDYFAAVSPDGKLIATFGFDLASETRGLYVIEAETDEVRRIAEINSPNFSALHVSWSPDSRWLVYSDYAGGQVPQQYDMFVIDKDGQNGKQLTKTPDEERRPVWSRTGNLIAFEVESPGRSDLGVVNRDGTGWANLSKPLDLACLSPEWLEIESSIVIACKKGELTDVFVVNPVTGTFLNVTNDGVSTAPVWLIRQKP
jgi:hypothetical protein